MPRLTEGHVNHYVVVMQGKGLSSSMNDIAAIKRGLKMTNAVLALSFSHEGSTSSTSVDRFYLTGIVEAEMKKTSYIVKVILHPATAEVLNSVCECPCGCGPNATCKHITSVLLLLVKFVSTGELSVSRSCTDTLQQFHRPKKPHAGQPVIAEKLGMGVPTSDDDPRPPNLRNMPGYRDLVRNEVIAFSHASGIDISWRYSFGSASLQEAVWDHYYLKEPFTHY